MIQYPRSNFSQRQFEVPIYDDSGTSPSYSYADSRSSSNQNTNQQLNQVQVQRNGSDASTHSPRRGFHLGNVFGNRKKSTEVKTNDDKIEKAPKRRGPKPDSKPALSRRQALNRQAQRTHRERKEYYTKALEFQVQDQKETLEKALSEKRAIEISKRQVDNENRLLRQLLQANNIPFVGSTAADTNQALLTGNFPNLNRPPVQSNITSYADANHLINNLASTSIASQSTTMSSTPPNLRTIPSNPSPSIQSSMSTGAPTPSYSPSEPSTIGLPTQPTNGFASYSPGGSSNVGLATQPPSSLSTQPTNSLATQPMNGLSIQSNNGLPTQHANGFTSNPQLSYPTYDPTGSTSDMSLYEGAPDRISKFKDGMDPRFISFVVELEENCKDHAGFMLERLNAIDNDKISGHALMFTAPPPDFIAQNPGIYEAKPPEMATPDLNTLLANSRQFSRNGEVTPVQAVHMIAEDPRFPLLSVQDFEDLKWSLKDKSRCYGFGAVLEDYEVEDAMNEACARLYARIE